MAESLRSAYDFVKSAFPVHVGVLASDDAGKVCQKNNLSFAELIEPFCTLTKESQLQGNGSQVYRVYNLHIHASNIRDRSTTIENPSTRNFMANLVAGSASNEIPQMISVPCGQHSLTVNRSCPWMEIYRDLVFRFGPNQEHEFLNHLVACMLVVPSSNLDPLQEFANLSQLQNHIQHGGSKDGTCQWMTPNTLKYYVLLHDVQNSDITKAKEVLSTLQGMYGQNVACLLQINSRPPSISESGQDLPVPWHHFRNYSTVERSEKSSEHKENGQMNAIQNSTSTKFGCCLTMSDHNALQGFVQQFITSALLPYLEKTIKNISEQLSARKAIHKSLFRATRTLFGSSKSTPSFGSTTGYHHDANELLLRKAADLCFLSQMYDQAFNLYHGAKKDNTNDQAWLYAAGASEMGAVSNFMQRNAQKNYPGHYMESAISSYMDVCKNEYLALRCTLLHVECLQHLGFFQDAAFFLVKMTNEADDLRSALLLEQAAHCYLKMKEPHPRKFAFQLILAGHRYSKCGQRTHALRCYDIVLQVYTGKDWQLAEDHLNLAIARQSYNTKQIDRAIDFFRRLLVKESSQPETQQASILREFINVFQQRTNFDESENHAALGLPQILINETEVIVGCEAAEDFDTAIAADLNAKITLLENSMLDSESLLRNQSVGATMFYCKTTANLECPQVAVGENTVLQMLCKNYLNAPICLMDVELKWDFEPWESDQSVHESDIYVCPPLHQVTLPPYGKSKAKFVITPLKPGKLVATAITYRVGQLSADEKVDDGSVIRDFQSLHIAGKRLNRTKEEKVGHIYNVDYRLSMRVYSVLPKIAVCFESFPASMVCNELASMKMIVQNVGSVPLDVLKICAFDPVQFTLVSSDGTTYYLPNFETSGDQLVRMAPNLSILQDRLLPSQCVEFQVRMKSPATPGSFKADMLFLCKSNELQSPSCRTQFVEHSIICHKGIDVHADMITPLSPNCFIVAVCMKNVAVADASMLLLEECKCLDSNCVIEPMSDQESAVLPQSTSVMAYYQLRRTEIKHSDAHVVKPNEKDSDNSVKIALRWSCERGTKNSTLQGEHQLDVKYSFSNLGTFSPVFLETRNQDENISSFSLQTMHHLVSWRLLYKPCHSHNFAASCLCYVGLKLVVFNLSNKELLVHVSLPQFGNWSGGQSQSGFSWVGTTEAKRVIEGHGEIDVPLKAIFSKPGIFNLSGVSVTALPNHLVGAEIPIPQKPLCGYYIDINNL